MHQFNQVTRAAMLLLVLTATSQAVLAQSRTCIIDEVNGQHRCGYLADEQGYRIADRPVYTQPAPVVIGRPGARNSFEERQAAEQKRMEVQEWVNSLFLDVLGRDADIVTLRRVAGQVMDGRAMTDVRIELATSAEARAAINQIYRDILRREADPSGLNNQMAALHGGLTLAQIRQAIAESPEGRNRR